MGGRGASSAGKRTKMTAGKNAERGNTAKGTVSKVSDVHSLGKLDLDKYKGITDKKILTDEVVVTDERLEHIKQRRGDDFLPKYQRYFEETIKDPDYVFKDSKNPDTALSVKRIVDNNQAVVLSVRIAVESDDSNFKNSVITSFTQGDKRFRQFLRNNLPVYKK